MGTFDFADRHEAELVKEAQRLLAGLDVNRVFSQHAAAMSEYASVYASQERAALNLVALSAAEAAARADSEVKSVAAALGLQFAQGAVLSAFAAQDFLTETIRAAATAPVWSSLWEQSDSPFATVAKVVEDTAQEDALWHSIVEGLVAADPELDDSVVAEAASEDSATALAQVLSETRIDPDPEATAASVVSMIADPARELRFTKRQAAFAAASVAVILHFTYVVAYVANPEWQAALDAFSNATFILEFAFLLYLGLVKSDED